MKDGHVVILAKIADETTTAAVDVKGMGNDVPRSFRLIPGMAVTAEIKAGERTILSYFLYPLLRGLDESIREP